MVSKIKSWFVNSDGPNPGRICIALGGLGLVLVLLGVATVWTTGWGKDLFAPGATLMTVALTAWVASRAVVKWAEQRERDRETAEYKHREDVYEQLATYMLNRFLAGDTPPDAETRLAGLRLDAQLRAKAALWGSAATVDALGKWQAKLTQVLANHGLVGGGQTAMTADEGKLLKEAFGDALVAMRVDLGSHTGQLSVRRETLLASIFND